MAHIDDFKEGDRVVYNQPGEEQDRGIVVKNHGSIYPAYCTGVMVKWDSDGSVLHASPEFLTIESTTSHITVESAIQFLIDEGYEISIRKAS